MNKHFKFLFFLIIAFLFLGVLYYINNTTSGFLGNSSNPKIYDQLKQKTEQLGKTSYNVASYNAVKSSIIGASVAKEISTDEKNSLLQILEIEKSNSLIISFDEKINSDCLNTSNLTSIINEMKRQQSVISLPKIQNKLDIYNNIVNFLNLQNKINAFVNGAYDQNRAIQLNTQINDLSNKDGVKTCNQKSSYITDWRTKISTLKNKDDLYKKIVDKPQLKNVLDVCGEFANYPYYRGQFACQ
jgi:hypothetical protein